MGVNGKLPGNHCDFCINPNRSGAGIFACNLRTSRTGLRVQSSRTFKKPKSIHVKPASSITTIFSFKRW